MRSRKSRGPGAGFACRLLQIILGPRLSHFLWPAAVGSLLTPFFTNQPVRDFPSATSARTDSYGLFFRSMLRRGVYPPPSQFEAWFLSAAHTPRDIDKTVDAARAAMKDVATDG